MSPDIGQYQILHRFMYFQVFSETLFQDAFRRRMLVTLQVSQARHFGKP